jgi:hypothetical protein
MILLTEQQTTIAIVLLVSVAHQGCTVSTYQYNCICYLVLMAVCANLHAILNVKNYFLGKGILFPILHLAMLGILLGLTGNMLWAKESNNFPAEAGPGQTWPAICFETGNYVTAANLESRWQNIASGNVQFILFVIFIAAACVLFIAEGLKHLGRRPAVWLQWGSIWYRIFFSIGALIVLIYSLVRYAKLRFDMEGNAEWYNNGESLKQNWNMSNLLAWAFFVRAIIMAWVRIAGTQHSSCG